MPEDQVAANRKRLVRSAWWWGVLLVVALALAVVVPVALRWRPPRQAYSVFGRWDCAAWAGNALFYLGGACALAAPVLLIGLIVAVVRVVYAARRSASSDSPPSDQQE
jgi:hypothetical protein